MEDIFEKAVRLRAAKVSFCMATIVSARGSTPRKAGTRMLVMPDGKQSGSIGGGALERSIIKECLHALKHNRCLLKSFDMTSGSTIMSCGGKIQVFMEPFYARPTLFILGAGHIGKALCQAASFCGIESVLLERKTQASGGPACNMPGKVIYLADFSHLPEGLHILSSDFIVTATGSHEEDFMGLKTSLKTDADFIGLVGSLKKKAVIFQMLRQQGISEKELERIVCPVGLKIGAQGPEEIAVSIMAQLIQWMRLQEKQEEGTEAQ